METLLRDLRFGLRMLVKSAGPTGVIVLVLALGIGANTTLFSVVYGVLLRPLPYSDPDRLVQIWEVNRAESNFQSTISPFNFLDWTAQNQSFERMAVYAFSSFTLLNKNEPTRLIGVKISGELFSVLSVKPMIGRPFGVEDDQPGSRVVALSHRTWQSRFGADPDLVGKKLTLNGEPYTVIAVMPPGFQFPNPAVELWTPPAFNLEGLDRGSHFLFGIGKLKPGVTAQSQMTAIANRLARQYPGPNRDSGIHLVPLHEQLVGGVRQALFILWGAVTLVLLIVCANVANLLLTRAVSRQREVSVRFAMGASRAQIIRQLLTESVLLVVAGGVAGLVLAAWGTHYVAAGGIPGIPRSESVQIDGWVLGFGAATSLLAALMSGLVPAFRGSRRELYPLVNQSAWQMPRGSASQRLSKLVVAFEVGVTVVLLITAALLLKSLYLLRRVDVGFDPKGLLTMQISLPSSVYPDPVQRAALFQQVIERIGALPGIDGIGGVSDLPFSGSRTQSSFEIAGLPSASALESRSADYRLVAGDYFRIMGIALLRGRTFELRDGPEAPRVAIINDALAQRYFRGVAPLGRSLIVQGSSAEIVGIVENLKHDSLAAVDAPEIYVPFGQAQGPDWIFLAVRSGLGPEPLGAAIRSAVREVIPEHPVYNIQRMEDRLARSIAPQRLNTFVLSTFASFALLLSLVGIYAVIAYAARQRTHEIAVRMALGARRPDVIRLVVVNGLIPVALGIAFGLAGALAASRLLRTMLFGIAPTDPAVFVLVPVFLAAVAILAGYLPARRATSVAPLAILRSD